MIGSRAGTRDVPQGRRVFQMEWVLMTSPNDLAKDAAAKKSLSFVEDGMRLGLGTGSTAALMVDALGQKVRNEGLNVTCVATSIRTAKQAVEAGIKVVSLDELKRLDLTIDGADEFDPNLNLIKGAGGALLREKIVATASDRMIVISDLSKQVNVLGAFSLPVEVIQFGWKTTQQLIEETLAGLDVLGAKTTQRMAGDVPYTTDEGNFIIDLHLKEIGDPRQVALMLNQIAGVVENGLLIDICDTVIIGHEDGTATLRDLDGSMSPDETADNFFV